jgi:hypothetical protein
LFLFETSKNNNFQYKIEIINISLSFNLVIHHKLQSENMSSSINTDYNTVVADNQTGISKKNDANVNTESNYTGITDEMHDAFTDFFAGISWLISNSANQTPESRYSTSTLYNISAYDTAHAFIVTAIHTFALYTSGDLSKGHILVKLMHSGFFGLASVVVRQCDKIASFQSPWYSNRDSDNGFFNSDIEVSPDEGNRHIADTSILTLAKHLIIQVNLALNQLYSPRYANLPIYSCETSSDAIRSDIEYVPLPLTRAPRIASEKGYYDQYLVKTVAEIAPFYNHCLINCAILSDEYIAH